jgi:chemotaxis protein CheD
MSGTIHVGMGELAVARAGSLESFVGSCVALCVYDSRNHIAAMAHVMLPDSRTERTPDSRYPAKFADRAVQAVIQQMRMSGGNAKVLRAKLAGGANMFRHEGNDGFFNIGMKNAERLRGLLKENGITVIAEHVGSDYGRQVTFSAESGELLVKARGRGESWL